MENETKKTLQKTPEQLVQEQIAYYLKFIALAALFFVCYTVFH